MFYAGCRFCSKRAWDGSDYGDLHILYLQKKQLKLNFMDKTANTVDTIADLNLWSEQSS